MSSVAFFIWVFLHCKSVISDWTPLRAVSKRCTFSRTLSNLPSTLVSLSSICWSYCTIISVVVDGDVRFLPLPSALNSISLLLTSQTLLQSGDTASAPLVFLVFRLSLLGNSAMQWKRHLRFTCRHSNKGERVETRLHSSIVDPDHSQQLQSFHFHIGKATL